MVTIMVTGATGKVGTKTINALLKQKDVQLKVAVRQQAKASKFFPTKVQISAIDYSNDSYDMTTILQGVDKLFMILPQYFIRIYIHIDRRDKIGKRSGNLPSSR